MLYRLLLLAKFVGVILYGGGLLASFIASAQEDRRRAVHGVASPGLLLTWCTGYLLTTQISVPLTELWVLGGLVLSLISQLALIHSLKRDRKALGPMLFSLVPLLLVLALMVFRPTWSG